MNKPEKVYPTVAQMFGLKPGHVDYPPGTVLRMPPAPGTDKPIKIVADIASVVKDHYNPRKDRGPVGRLKSKNPNPKRPARSNDV